jgi:phospholipase C
MAAALVLCAGRIGAPASGAPIRSASQTAAAPAAPDTIHQIQHVVLIMQENHSFDNVLGKFCAEVTAKQIVRPGYDHGCDGATTGTLFNNKQVTLRAAPDVIPSSVHSVAAQTADIAGGQMNGFDSTGGSCTKDYPECYNQYDPLAGTCTSGTNTHATCIPYLGALATKYTVAGQVFELADAPSWGGHLYAAAATTDGFTGDNPTDNTLGFPLGPGWGCDSGRVTAWGSPPTTQIPSCVPDSTGSLGPAATSPWNGYTGPKAAYVPTIFDRLDAANLTWKLYAGGGGRPDPGDSYFQRDGWQWAICPSFAECLYGPQRANVVAATQIISGASNLPAFSIVTPTTANSQHNGFSMLTGDNWINQIVSAIQASPDWSSTAIFITYDDCGCFYDHVPPPNGWGVRVPMVIVSPYAKLGYSDGTPTTVAGVLAFAEHVFGLTPLNSTDANAYDFSASFCFAGPPKCTPAGLAPVKLPLQRVNPLTPAQLATQQQDSLQDT